MTMHPRQRRIWVAAALFVAAVSTVAAIGLLRSRRALIDVTYTKADLTGYLVSEWIAESFSSVEYVLKDSLAAFESSSIDAATRTPEENRRINELFVSRALQHGNIVFLGLFDSDCVIQNGSIESIIGDSSRDLGRAYCREVMRAPVEQLKLSDFFVSSTGEMNVAATYPLTADDGGVIGFSLAGLDLAFFQRWLDRIEDPSVTITIMDANQTLLARTPLSCGIGRHVEDPTLKRFVTSDAQTILDRVDSPLDGIDRLWSLRKIRELPFVVAVGYTTKDVLAPWYAELVIYVLGVALLAIVSTFLAMAYHKNSLTAKHMEELAMKDQLTGLMNRRSFTEIARRRIDEALRAKRKASAVMIDVDHFKRVNDTLGHEAGDAVLKQVSQVIRSSFRSSDLVCRWGGEEFIVLLDDTDHGAAIGLAERLNENISGSDFLGSIRVTVSQGIASLDQNNGDGFETILRRADEMLYKAKASGRNCVRWI